MSRLTVSPRTARRWRARGRPARSLLGIAASGELGQLWPAWDGWRVLGKNLVAPDGRTWSRGELDAAYYRGELLRELQTMKPATSAPRSSPYSPAAL